MWGIVFHVLMDAKNEYEVIFKIWVYRVPMLGHIGPKIMHE